MILHCVLSDDRKRRMSGRRAFWKGPLKDDHVTIRNIAYDPSPRGKSPSSESTLSKLFIRNGLILHMP